MDPWQLILEGVKWVLRRPRLKVRVIDDGCHEPGGELRFEVENRSALATSLRPEVTCRYAHVSGGRWARGRMRFFVRESPRLLAPFNAVVFTATPDRTPDHYLFSWYRTYVFKPARGVRTRVRVRNAHLEVIPTIAFAIELARLQLTGYVPPDPHSSVEDMERLARSRGPH